MRFILRVFLLIPLAILLAAVVSACFLTVASFIQPELGGALLEGTVLTLSRLMDSLLADGEALDRFGRLAEGLSRLTLAVLLLPVALVAVVSEAFSLRSFLLQLLLAALLTALLPWAMLPELLTGEKIGSTVTGLLAATGALAGLVYWMLAGHAAGSGPPTVEDRATVRAPAVKR
jgi:hypothetical protein